VADPVERSYEYRGKVYGPWPVNYDLATNPNREDELKFELERAAIAEATKHNVGPISKLMSEVWGSANRVPRMIDLTNEAREGAQLLMSQGIDKIKENEPFEGAWKLLLGSLGFTFSVIEGPARAWIGEPSREIAESAGAGPKTAQFVEDITALGPQVLTPGAYAKAVSAMAPQAQLSTAMRVLANKKAPVITTATAPKIEPTLRPLDDVPETPVSKADDPIPVDTTTEGTVPRMSLKTTEDLVFEPTLITRAHAAREEAGGDTERFFRTFGRVLKDAIDDGEVDMFGAVRAARAAGVKDEDLAKLFEVSVSESARTMNLLSQAVRRGSKMEDLPKNVREEMRYLADDLEKRGGSVNMNRWMKGWRRFENAARASMVGQTATAMRNAISQTGRLSLGILDDAMRGAMEGTTAGESMENIIHSLSADARAMPMVRDKKLLNDILDGNPITSDRLLNKSVHEVDALGKVANFVNGLNIFQEKMFRRIAFQSKLDKTLKQSGLDIKTIDPERIPAAALEEAVDHALQMTFAHSGGEFARGLTKAWEKFPALYWIQPFPRFAYANSIPFLLEHSPYGLIKSMSPKSVAELASGNSKQFTRAASRGLIGTTLLAKAIEMRNDPEVAGENWYEVRLPSGKIFDARPYAPLTQYLFFAEAMKEDSNLRPRDWFEAMIGVNRVAGTGLAVVDWVKATDVEQVIESAQRMAGELAARITVPLRTPIDIIQGVTGTERRTDPKGDTWEETLINPTLANIPVVNERVSERFSPLRTETGSAPLTLFGIDIPAPLSRQLLGISLKKKNAVESEVDRLQIKYSTFMPKTGQRDVDRQTMAHMGPIVLRTIPEMMKSDSPIKRFYSSAAEWTQRKELVTMMSTQMAEEFRELDINKPYKELDDEGKRLVLMIAFATHMADAKAMVKKEDLARAKERSLPQAQYDYAVSKGWQPSFPQ